MRKSNFWKIPAALVLAVIFAYSFHHYAAGYSIPELKNRLMLLYPQFTLLTLAFLLIGMFLSAPAIRTFLRELDRRTLLLAAGVSVFGVLMTAFVAPRTNRIYFDEHIYQHTARNISLTGEYFMCNDGEFVEDDYHPYNKEYNKWSVGYPVLLSVLYDVFGASEIVAFVMNNVLFGLAIFLVFMIGTMLFSKEAGFLSALIYALIPQNLIWFNTAAVEPSSAFFICLTIAAFLLYTRTGQASELFFAIMTACFAATFRVDVIIILPVLALILLLKKPKTFLNPDLYLFAGMALLLLLFHFLHLYSVRGESWGSDGPRFALSYLRGNLNANMGLFLKNKDFPVIFSLLFFPAILPIGRLRSRLIALAWFTVYFGIFLIFYAGSYYYGADMRFALLAMPPFALMAGCGAAALNSFVQKSAKISLLPITAVIFGAFILFLPGIKKTGEEAWTARADVKYAKVMLKSIPDDSIVLTHNPGMFLLWGMNAAQASITQTDKSRINFFLEKYRGGVYFHFNFWCNVDDPAMVALCRNILNDYDTDKIIEFKKRNYTYALYRINSPNTSTVPDTQPETSPVLSAPESPEEPEISEPEKLLLESNRGAGQ